MAAKERLEEAEKQVPIREKELEDYRKWVDSEIDRLYSEVIRKDVHRGAIDDLATTIRAMRSKEPDYIKRVEDAKEDVKKAKEEVEAKKSELSQVQRDLEKLYAHREQWNEEQAKLEEFASDKEMEESVRQKNQNEEVSLDEVCTAA
jgi:chromosome segregation ATPase